MKVGELKAILSTLDNDKEVFLTRTEHRQHDSDIECKVSFNTIQFDVKSGGIILKR